MGLSITLYCSSCVKLRQCLIVEVTKLHCTEARLFYWVHWAGVAVNDDEVMLNVLRCQLTYQGQAVTNAEAWFSIALLPWKPEGSLGQAAQDGHLHSHTAPELWLQSMQIFSIGTEFFRCHTHFSHTALSLCTKWLNTDLWLTGGMPTFPKNDNNYFEPKLYKICVWKKNQTETEIAQLVKLISDILQVINSGQKWDLEKPNTPCVVIPNPYY